MANPSVALPTPAELLERASALSPLIRQHAAWSDEHRQLAAPVAQAMANAGLYRSALPQCAGGVGLDPHHQILLIETVAQADGASGWNLMIGMENYGLAAPNMSKCADLIADPTVIMCSSTAAAFPAVPTDNGYRISGRWPFASGCHNSQLFAATVLLDAQNPTSRVYALLTQDQYQIEDSWHVSGMRGSGSHDISVNDAFVPSSRVFPAIGAGEHNDVLLRFLLGARLAYNKVAVALGITRNAINEFVNLAANKKPRFSNKKLDQSSLAATAVADAETAYHQCRSWVLAMVDEFWMACNAGASISAERKALFQIACSNGVAQCNQAVAALGAAAGTSANDQASVLNRCLRDLPVVRSHTTVAPQHIEDGGRVLLGQRATGLMLKGLS